jgi:phospholipid/cholesterol/gamma-HCH transport system ATP-binding protein
MFVLDAIHKSYGDNHVLRDVSCEIGEGEILGIAGPSGAGKSVLLKILGNVEQPDSGSLRRFNEDGGESESTASVGFLFQESALFDSLSVLENVAFPLVDAGKYQSSESKRSVDYESGMQKAYDVLEAVGLSHAYKKHPGQLSGGMRRRVGIARALVCSPDLVLLDDPTGGLDPVAARVIMDLIAELHQRYTPSVVIVSHDLRRMIPSVERLLVLFDGSISADTSIESLEHSITPRVRSFLSTRYDFSKSV